MEIQKSRYLTAKQQCQHYSRELSKLHHEIVRIVGELGSKGPFLRQTHLRIYTDDFYTWPIIDAYNEAFPADGVTAPHPPHLIQEISDEIDAAIAVMPGLVRLQDSLSDDSCLIGGLQSKFTMPRCVSDVVLELFRVREVFHESVKTESRRLVEVIEYWSDVRLEEKIWNKSELLLVVRQLERLREVLKSLDAFIWRYEKAKYAD